MNATNLPHLPAIARRTDHAHDCEQFSFAARYGSANGTQVAAPAIERLGAAPVGFRGRILAVDATGCGHALPKAELERRLLEMGFVEGAVVEIRNQGLFGRNPIAVRLHDATIALRRAEANAIRVEVLDIVR